MSSLPPLLHPISPSLHELHDFLTRHIDLLKAERLAEVEQTSLLASNCSPKLLEKKGLAIGGLGVSSISIGLGGKTMIELHLPLAYSSTPLLPPHTFRVGDPARLEQNPSASGAKKKTSSKIKDKEMEDNEGVEGVVAKISQEKIILSVETNKEIDLPERLRLIKLANSATFDRMDKTLRYLSRLILNPSFDPSFSSSDPSAILDSGSSRQSSNLDLLRVLMGSRRPTWGELPLLPLDVAGGAEGEGKRGIKWFDEGLNQSQREAVEFCLQAEEVGCIHGPPGTGKTYTLVEIIRQLVLVQGKRVLVCGASNLAVDNLLTRLSPLFPASTLLRLGHPARISPQLLTRTLDYVTSHSDEAGIVKDVKGELEGNMKVLTRKKGEKGWVRGAERGKMWGDVRELRKEYRIRESKVVKNVVGAAKASIKVVLSTCHGAGSRQINNMEFDVCIIDEATQAVEAVCWIPILKAKKLILAGDPQQLPPTILSKNDKANSKIAGKSLIEKSKAAVTPPPPAVATASSEPADNVTSHMVDLDTGSRPRLKPPRSLETTLFDRLERLYGEGIKRVLKVQYRMHESIASFPSHQLYASALSDHESVAKRRLLDLPGIIDPESEDSIDVLGPSVVFFDTAGSEMYERTEGEGEVTGKAASIGDTSRYNENEAEIASKWIRQLIELGVPPADIAVVTPYHAQVAHISGLLREDFPDLIIGSVDGMQGQEREVIVLSLVRSNPAREVGFLSEYRRLNVAMTRAKRQLCIIGDSSTVGNGSKYLNAWIEWLEENADVRFPDA